MVNRVLEVKVLKIKRRRMKLQGKFTSSQIASDRVISLSKQIINVGLRVPGMSLKGPLDKAAYQLHNPKKRDLSGPIPAPLLPKREQVLIALQETFDLRNLAADISKDLTLKLSKVLSEDQNIWLKTRIISTQQTWVYVFFDSLMKDIYLVRISFSRQTVDRSINYRTIAAAQEAAMFGNVVWRRHNPQ